MPATAQVTFPVWFDGTATALTSQERADVTSHLQDAGRRWAELIDVDGPREIDIRVSISNIPTANARSTATAFVTQVEGRNMFEQGAAHELRTGVDPNGATHDVEVTFGLDYLRNELWFDPDPAARTAPIASGRTDAMSVALHELGHALAYNGWASGFGAPNPGYWSFFDSWMIQGNPATNTAARFGGPMASAAWGLPPELTRNNVMHWGNAAPGAFALPMWLARTPVVRWINGAPQPLACEMLQSVDAPPSALRPHAQTSQGSGDLVDTLMNGVVFYRDTRYHLTALDHGVLVDVGLAADPHIFASGFEAH